MPEYTELEERFKMDLSLDGEWGWRTMEMSKNNLQLEHFYAKSQQNGRDSVWEPGQKGKIINRIRQLAIARLMPGVGGVNVYPRPAEACVSPPFALHVPTSRPRICMLHHLGWEASKDCLGQHSFPIDISNSQVIA